MTGFAARCLPEDFLRYSTRALPRSVPWLTAVISSSVKPVSAKQNLSLPRPRGRAILCPLLRFLFFFVLAFMPQSAHGDSLEESARLLAGRVGASIHGTTVGCEFRNLSSISSAESASFSTAFQEELQRRGVKIQTGDAAVGLVVRVTQNATEYLGVVRIQRKENIETIIEVIGPVLGPAAPQLTFNYSLRKRLLFSQDNPIMDVVLNDDDERAEALGIGEIYQYELRGGQWLSTGTQRLPSQAKEGRELRGFLGYGLDYQSVQLPGEICVTSISADGGWSCKSSGEPWMVRTVSVDALAGKKLAPWFSAAQFAPASKPEIVVTGRDGLARLYEESTEPVANFPNWGSEIASIKSACGSGWQLLVTGKTDWTRTDELRAVEVRERRAQLVSTGLEFPGPVIALHSPSMRPSQDKSANDSAVAIIRNLQTGRYEAYLVTITCSN
jgi:hypothetical protein